MKKKYTTKPIIPFEIEAIQFDGTQESIDEIMKEYPGKFRYIEDDCYPILIELPVRRVIELGSYIATDLALSCGYSIIGQTWFENRYVEKK